MKSAPLHPQESDRLEALIALGLLDTLPEQDFDEITLLASQICKTPIALISLVDDHRQWFKSKVGLEAAETPREVAFCAHAILQKDPFIVRDSKKDPRFSDNPLVTQAPQVEFYAGLPITDPKSQLPIGTLCVIDHSPRELDADQLKALHALRNQVQRLLKLRIELNSSQSNERSSHQATVERDFLLSCAQLTSWDWWPSSGVVELRSLTHQQRIEQTTIDHLNASIHPDDFPEAMHRLNLYLNQKMPNYESVHRIQTPDGKWGWTLERGLVRERDSNGTPLKFTATRADIDQFKKSQELSEQMQSSAQIGGWELDLKTGYTQWTTETYKIHGIPIGTPTNKIMGLDFYPATDRPRLVSLLEQCQNGAPFRETFGFVDALHVKKDVAVTGKPVRDHSGAVIAIQGTFQDVTQANEALRQLIESQQIAKIGSWWFDLKTQKQTWSDEHYAIFEISKPQSQEELFRLYRERIHPEDRAQLDRLTAGALADGQDFVYNHRVYLDEGRRIKHVQGRGQVNNDSTGKPISISGTCQDISEKVTAEKEIELARAKAIQASKLASLGEMAAGIAHEINNPLGIISGSLYGLPKVRDQEEKFSKKIATMDAAIHRIVKIVNGLRKFSRAPMPRELKMHSLSTIIEETLVLTGTRSKQKNVSVKIPDPCALQVHCDPIEIEQVLINLINNAIDAAAETPDPWVEINLDETRDSVIVSVRDSGPGISPEIEEKLFQPFFTTKPVGSGTGLGLSICKGIVDAHQASISLNRNDTHTCFEIRFPKKLKDQ
jgi:signal transduction histidine kinase